MIIGGVVIGSVVEGGVVIGGVVEGDGAMSKWGSSVGGA